MKHTPASGTIARKFVINITVGLTFAKRKAMPTGMNTNIKLTQLENIISLNNLNGVFSWAREVTNECRRGPSFSVTTNVFYVAELRFRFQDQ